MQQRGTDPLTIGQPPQPPRRGGKAGLIAAVAAVGLLVGGGVYYGTRTTGDHTGVPVPALTSVIQAAAPSTFTLTGTFTLRRGGFERLTDAVCAGYDGFDDIQAGTQVVVTDQGGAVIATGSLSAGDYSMVNGSPTGCKFLIDVPNVPGDRTFYGIQVSHRGVQTYSAAQAKSGAIALTLG